MLIHYHITIQKIKTGGIKMSDSEYIKCIITMLGKAYDNHKLKVIFEFVHRIIM